MKRWHYTDDIHDYITIHNKRFKLNTAYDNIFVLFKKANNLDTYLQTIFYKKDHAELKRLTEEWNFDDYNSLIDHINKNILFLDNKSVCTQPGTVAFISSSLSFSFKIQLPFNDTFSIIKVSPRSSI